MFNILLDEKPTNWNGYPINSDFRIGIQIMQIMYDCEISDYEKNALIIELLFPGLVPSANEDIADCIRWFISGWYTDNETKKKKDTKRVYDFDVDQWRIYSAFMSQYRINLNSIQYLHFWEFMGLLSNLEECAFSRVNSIRTKQITSKMDKSEKKALEEAKKIYALHEEVKIDNQQEVDEAMAIFRKAQKGE